MTWGQPPFYVHQLIHDTWLSNGLAIEVDGSSSRVEGRASAQISDDGARLVVRWVNQGPQSQTLRIAIRGVALAPTCVLWTYQHDELAAANTPARPRALTPSSKTIPSGSLSSLAVKKYAMLTVQCNTTARQSPLKTEDGASPRPHICFILADDWGQYNAGYRGDPQSKTPGIDTLAAEGLVLERFYVHKWCAPTRSALMTGRNPMHTGLDPLNWSTTIMRGEGCDPPDNLAGCDSSLSAEYVFLPRLLQAASYSSHMLGKW